MQTLNTLEQMCVNDACIVYTYVYVAVQAIYTLYEQTQSTVQSRFTIKDCVATDFVINM